MVKDKITKIYISGPMTGIEKFNYPAFHKAERMLNEQGYKTFNPANIKGTHEWTWQDYMRECIRAIPDCNKMYVLKNWEKSKGVNVELYIAVTLGLKIIYEE